MTNLEKQIAEQTKQLLALETEKKKQDAEKAKQKAFEYNSKVRLVQFLEQYLDNQIRLGKLTSETFYDVFRKYRQVYLDLDDQLALFVGTVIKLISHPWYGVECSTAFIGNGGLMYKGETYKDPQKLYEVIFSNILGDLADDPFGSSIWFFELLQLHFADPTAFPAYAQIGEVKTRVLPLLQKVVELDKNSRELPDISGLTADDAMYLQSLLGF